MPHGFTPTALRVPVARGNASVRALMRRIDFYIMRQTWILKNVKGWAEVAATMVSVAISVVASMAAKAIGGAVANKLAGQRGLSAGKALGKFLLDAGKVILQEFAEELVLEPIFGEWFHTAFSMAGEGDGHKRGNLASGSRANGWPLFQGRAAASRESSSTFIFFT